MKNQQNPVKHKNLRLTLLMAALVVSILWANSPADNLSSLQGKTGIETKQQSQATLTIEAESETNTLSENTPTLGSNLLKLKLRTGDKPAAVKGLTLKINKTEDKSIIYVEEPKGDIDGLLYITDDMGKPLSTAKEALNDRSVISLYFREPLLIGANQMAIIVLKGDMYEKTDLQIAISNITTTTPGVKISGTNTTYYIIWEN